VLIFLDGERYISEAIDSVVQQSGFEDWELILVDDGSTDASSAIAKGWAQTDPQRIRYVEHPGHQNRGMSASRNLGVQSATGTYIAFLDADDVWLPSALAHRMRVAAAFPVADVIVGGTWRWHSWTHDAGDLDLDVRMTLPTAPAYTILAPPALLIAIYGIVGGGQVPAMCSLVIRRDSLVSIGGMVSDFRDLYEDQVLYVKLGLKLSAVVDPRPLALYRQHPASACSLAVARGEWNPASAGEPGERFFQWMLEYVRAETGPGSRELELVQRNVAHMRRGGADHGPTGLRAFARRHLPERALAVWRQVRNRRGTNPPEQGPSIVQLWSSQFLEVIAAAMVGDVLVVVPTDRTDEPWTADVPNRAFGSARAVRRHTIDQVPEFERFDHVVVPLQSSLGETAQSILTTLHRFIRPTGSAAVLMAGRDQFQTASADTGPNPSAHDLLRAARGVFPNMSVTVETFGNEVTAAAVAGGTAAGEVPGVVIDRHDGRTEVLVALLISAPARASTLMTLDDQATA
jgi:glycosyltransferase involved in cell wall biosynthesis